MTAAKTHTIAFRLVKGASWAGSGPSGTSYSASNGEIIQVDNFEDAEFFRRNRGFADMQSVKDGSLESTKKPLSYRNIRTEGRVKKSPSPDGLTQVEVKPPKVTIHGSAALEKTEQAQEANADPLACAICGKVCKTAAGVKAHIRIVHTEPAEYEDNEELSLDGE